MEQPKTAWEVVRARMLDPTTYSGIAGVAAATGWNVTADPWKGVFQAVMFTCGVLAIILLPKRT